MEHLIQSAQERPLESVPWHGAGPLIRWLMAGADVHPGGDTHIAVHRVSATEQARAYCDVHVHRSPEFNLLLPITELTYDVTLGDEHFVVEAPASIHIPAGTPHSANVRSGTGFFVAIVLGIQDYEHSLVPVG